MKLLPLLISAVLLTTGGCASQNITYYRLPNSAFQLPATTQQPVQINIVLNDSINQGNLLYQASPNTLHFAQQHQWADDLSHEIASNLANHLNQLNHHYAFSPRSQTNTNTDTKTLTIYIERFQGSYDGHIHISGYSQWQGLNGQNKNFQIRIAQQGDGYTNMVNALAQGLIAVAQQINPY